MVRIPEAELELIKREIDLAALVTRAGVELHAHGDNLIGRCVFHQPDNNPSLVVTRSKNLFHCMACGTAGSVIDWVMKTERVTFRHAVEILRQQLTSLAASSLAADGMPMEKPRINLNADAQTLLNDTVASYQNHIEEAWPYLESRWLDSAELVRAHRLGFANRTLGYQLPNKQLKAGKEIRARLTELGILRESGHEHLAGSLVIPIFDEAGNVVELYGRKVTARLREGTPLHLYLKGSHKGVWNWQGIVDAKEVILCEALIDALTMWRAGFHNVTSSYGVQGFTEEHLEAFGRYGTRRVLIAYDRDEAGDTAARALAQQLSAVGISCARLEFPVGMDANEYALSLVRAEDDSSKQIERVHAAFSALIERAVPISDAAALSGNETAMPACDIADEAVPQTTIEHSHTIETIATHTLQHEQEPVAPEQVVSAVPVTQRGEDIFIQLGEREYRVRGLSKNLSVGQMKVNVRLSWRGNAHQDTVDIALYRGKRDFAQHAQTELGIKDEIVRKDLSTVLNQLEELQDEQIKKTLERKEPEITLTPAQAEAALGLLKDPRLIERIRRSFRECGIVGEETNMLVGYLAAVSRKLEHPLAVLIQSSSAAGKSSLMEAVLGFMPKEEVVKYSALTGQALFYLGDINVEHKILAFSEEEGVQRASYALKLLQSEGELSIAATGKDPVTGRLVTQQYKVVGPVMLFTTTTAIDIDEELKNRCIVLVVCEDRAQTRAIHQMQREQYTVEGLVARRRRKQLLELHQNAQRLLQPVAVINPYARYLTFMDNQTRTRRDHLKYLGLINAIAYLHQYQRPRRTIEVEGQREECVEVTLADIEMANRLANEVLGRSLDDMPPQTRRLLMQMDELVSGQCKELRIKRVDYRFTQREVREYTGLSNTQVKLHLERLAELEYVIVHRGGRGQQFVYELLYDGEGKEGEKFLVGLIDVAELRKCEYDAEWSGEKAGWSEQNSKWSDTGRDENGVETGTCRNGEMSGNGHKQGAIRINDEEIVKNAFKGEVEVSKS